MELSENLKLRERKAMFWLLAVLCCVNILPFLGLTEFNTKGEPREAVVSLTMLMHDNWILPVNNGGDIPYKPPFFHWMIAICSLLTGGEVTEYTSRLPSALALIGMTLGTFAFFVRRQGNRIAFITSLVAFSTLELHRAGMNARVDMVLTALSVGAIMMLYRWGERGMRDFPWLAILLMSCATLTKGPVGIVLPCLVAGVWLLLSGARFFRVFILLVIYGLIALVIPLLWYYAAYRQGGREFLDLVLEENFGRMTGTMSYESHVNPWPYNLLTVITGFVPWTLAAVMALFVAPWRRLRTYRWRDAWGDFRSMVRNFTPDRKLAFTAVAVIFLFYCIPSSKRSVYLMPLYPFLALFVADLLLWMGREHERWLKAFGDILAGLSAAAAIGFPIAFFGDMTFVGWVSAAVSILVAALWWMAWRIRLPEYKLPAACAMIAFGFFVSLGGCYQPMLLNRRSVRPVALEIEAAAPESKGHLYEFIGYAEFDKSDMAHQFELNFYLHDRILNFISRHPDSGFLVISDEDARNYFPQFEAQGYTFTPVLTTSRKLMKLPSKVYSFVRHGEEGPIHLSEVKQ